MSFSPANSHRTLRQCHILFKWQIKIRKLTHLHSYQQEEPRDHIALSTSGCHKRPSYSSSVSPLLWCPPQLDHKSPRFASGGSRCRWDQLSLCEKFSKLDGTACTLKLSMCSFRISQAVQWITSTTTKISSAAYHNQFVSKEFAIKSTFPTVDYLLNW